MMAQGCGQCSYQCDAHSWVSSCGPAAGQHRASLQGSCGSNARVVVALQVTVCTGEATSQKMPTRMPSVRLRQSWASSTSGAATPCATQCHVAVFIHAATPHNDYIQHHHHKLLCSPELHHDKPTVQGEAHSAKP